MNGQVRGGPPASPNPVTNGLPPGEGLPRTLAATKVDGEFRSPVGRPGGDPWVFRSPHPSSVQTALAPSTQARLLPLIAAGGGRERLFSLRRARKASGGRTSSPGCRLPTPKPDSSYLWRDRSTVSTATQAPAHARRIAAARAQRDPRGSRPILLCSPGARLRAFFQRAEQDQAERGARGPCG